jgi:hypothetical protein
MRWCIGVKFVDRIILNDFVISLCTVVLSTRSFLFRKSAWTGTLFYKVNSLQDRGIGGIFCFEKRMNPAHLWVDIRSQKGYRT